MPACAGADTSRAPTMATAPGGDGAEMRRAVMRLSFGATSWEERAEAAAEVGRLARSDERTKRALPELGVVPPLLSMLVDAGGGGGGAGARMAAVRALLELARGTHRNKVLIVKAGLLKKLPQLLADRDLATSHDLALLLLSVSSLANTDFPLSSAELLPFLVATLGDATDVPVDTRLSCLAALRNLSANLGHVRAVAASGVVRALFALSLDETTSEAALGVLSDVAAASSAGRREMAEDEAAPRALVEAVARHGSARCQEHVTYLVMALAHGGGAAGRELMRRMRRLGAVQALLEVSLLGSPLAQSRAAKILQWFKDDGQDRIRAHSGPRTETSSCHGRDGSGAGGSKKACQNAVDRIVKQSLDRNMKSIMRRATGSVDMTSTSATKLLEASSSSKSLPC